MLRLGGLWAAVFLLAWCQRLGQAEPVASLEVTGAAVQPAGLPVLLTFTVRNTGNEPIGYWSEWAGGFPDASHFSATLFYSGRARATFVKRLSNCDDTSLCDAGRMRRLMPGQSVSFPAALPPLPAGTFSLRVVGEPEGSAGFDELADTWFPATLSAALKLEVRHDEILAGLRDADILSRARKGEPFAQHVARLTPRPVVRQGLEESLLGTDLVAAEAAVDVLWPNRDPSPDGAALVIRAIRSHLKPINEGHDEWLMHVLTQMARANESPAMTTVLHELATARPAGRVRRYALAAIPPPKPVAVRHSAPTTRDSPEPAAKAQPATDKQERNRKADEVFQKMNSVAPAPVR